jgi:hypothetical protein
LVDNLDGFHSELDKEVTAIDCNDEESKMEIKLIKPFTTRFSRKSKTEKGKIHEWPGDDNGSPEEATIGTISLREPAELQKGEALSQGSRLVQRDTLKAQEQRQVVPLRPQGINLSRPYPRRLYLGSRMLSFLPSIRSTSQKEFENEITKTKRIGCKVAGSWMRISDGYP